MAEDPAHQQLLPSQRLMAMLGKPVPPAPTQLEIADFQRWMDEGDTKLAAWIAQRRSSAA